MNFEEVAMNLFGDGGQESNLIMQAPSMLPVYSEYCYHGLDCKIEDIVEVIPEE